MKPPLLPLDIRVVTLYPLPTSSRLPSQFRQ
jgi:hypothetical protein